MSAISIQNLTKVYPHPLPAGAHLRGAEPLTGCRAGAGLRAAGPQWLRQEHDHEDRPRPRLARAPGAPASSGATAARSRAARRSVSSRRIPTSTNSSPGEETLHFYGKICGLSGAKLRERSSELLHLVGLEHARDRRLGGYSKGMLQRIGLAQALIQQPRLLVLDEPTAGVDPAGSREIRDLILDFKKRGITVLLCSHLLSQVQEICDRIGILHKGVLVREGRLDELISIENQTEIILENATPEVLAQVHTLLAGSGARIVAERRPQTTLEDFFLEVTTSQKE